MGAFFSIGYPRVRCMELRSVHGIEADGDSMLQYLAYSSAVRAGAAIRSCYFDISQVA